MTLDFYTGLALGVLAGLLLSDLLHYIKNRIRHSAHRDHQAKGPTS